MEYLSHLTDSLQQNNERIMMEKQALFKLEKSFNEIKPKFKETLERQQENIEFQIERQNKLYEIDKKQQEEDAKVVEKGDDGAGDKKESEKDGDQEDDANKADEAELLENREDKKVDTDKIKAVTTMVDEFNNIVAKNFSVYG